MIQHTVTLYGKKDCCLCDDAKAVLEKVRIKVPFHYETVDITSDPELSERYGTSIPVIAVDGVQAFRYRVVESRLIALLTADAGECSA